MLVLVDPEIATIPGSAGAFTQTVTNAGPRIIVHDASALTANLWSASPLYADITLTVTYDDTLSRVRLVGSGLDSFTAVAFERSSDQIRWTTVRGGTDVDVAVGEARLDDYEFAANALNYYRLRTLAPFGQTSDVESITPTLDTPWLKSVARPFLNQPIEFGGDQLPIQRPPRGGVFDIVGRSLPVAVTDVRGSRRYTVVLRTETDQEADDLDLLLASGDVLFTHGSTCRVPSDVYWYVGQVTALEPIAEDPWRLTSLDVVEVAAPGPDVVSATASWQTVINTYGSWEDVLAAHATWADLLELIGDPSEVIVP